MRGSSKFDGGGGGGSPPQPSPCSQHLWETLKVITKVNARLKFLHQKNKYLTPNLHHLLCNALMQPHFDYACSA